MTEQQIRHLVDRWAEAELHGDSAALERLLGPDFAGIGPVGFTLTRQQWTGRHRGGGLTNHHLAVLEPQVRLYGDTAIVVGVQEQRTTARGRDSSGSFRLTLVAVNRQDGWEIVHLQLSGPLQAPDQPPPFARDPRRPGERRTISRDDLRAAIGAGAVTVVDALPEPAYLRRHLPGALNLTAETVEREAAKVLPDRTAAIVVYSTDTACTRGPGLVGDLEKLGYGDVRLYAEGIEDWAGAGLPIEP
ncbi:MULTISPECIES: DUF4440 domain-containing protein [unclassified Nonomuraea]|uniref:DUF4440 domain-containing protein n=1 Tax=unclassified Nonomuraea TaxID=2593643 RepID=UPI0033E5E095